MRPESGGGNGKGLCGAVVRGRRRLRLSRKTMGCVALRCRFNNRIPAVSLDRWAPEEQLANPCSERTWVPQMWGRLPCTCSQSAPFCARSRRASYHHPFLLSHGSDRRVGSPHASTWSEQASIAG
jgi:hypothetical protein